MHAVMLLPQFRLQSVLRWRDAGGPVAVVDGDASKGVVLEATEAAMGFGVGPGISVAQAMARCEGLRVLGRVPEQERACDAALVEAALTFSPKVEATASGVVTLDLSNLSRTVCWQQLAERMVARLAAVELRGHVGVAGNPDHAMLAARCAADGNGVCVVRDAGAFFAELPLEEVFGSGGDLLDVLGDWGIRTVGEFARMPREAVIERLGPEAGLVWRQIAGRTKRVLRLVVSPEEFVEAFEFDLPVETTGALLFLLRRFVDSLGDRLREAGKVAGRMVLALPLDDGTELRREFSVPAPTTDAAVLFRILDTFLEALKLEAQPVGVRLTMVAERPANCQLQLFGQGLRDPNRFGETLARLHALVGEGCVGVPRAADSWRPGDYELDGMEALEFQRGGWGGAEGGGEERVGLPLRRWRTERVWKGWSAVARSAGPYRSSGDWWERGWRVEEWDVEMADGALLRVARRGGGQGWVVVGGYEGESKVGRSNGEGDAVGSPAGAGFAGERRRDAAARTRDACGPHAHFDAYE